MENLDMDFMPLGDEWVTVTKITEFKIGPVVPDRYPIVHIRLPVIPEAMRADGIV